MTQPPMKTELRRQLREHRRELVAADDLRARGRRASTLTSMVLAHPAVQAACDGHATIASYASMDTEPPTGMLNDAMTDAGARVVLPVVERTVERFTDLGWADHVVGGATRRGPFGIHAPSGPVLGRGGGGLQHLGCQVVLVPALAVGRDGSRLGQGGGFYDRLLAGLPADHPLRLAIVFADEVFDTLPDESHDQRVHGFVAVPVGVGQAP